MNTPTCEELLKLANAASKNGEHIYTNPRDCNNWQANEAWHHAASPEAFIALLSAHQAQGEPVMHQHRKPICKSDGELAGYSEWIDGKGLDGWPHRTLYAAPPSSAQTDQVQREKIIDAFGKGANQGWNGAVEAADKVRLHLSEKYQERLQSGTSQMNGNMDWARLEGAVAVVSALRSLKRPLQAQEPQLLQALMALYKAVKDANIEAALEMEPLFSDEIEAIDHVITPDLVDQAIAASGAVDCQPDELPGMWEASDLQGGETDSQPSPVTDELPPLPAGRKALFPCEDCEGTGCTGEMIPATFIEPAEPVLCSTCNGSGRGYEAIAYEADDMREYARLSRAQAAQQAQAVSDLEARDRVAKALDLDPGISVGGRRFSFAWEYLLGLIEDLVKASEQSAAPVSEQPAVKSDCNNPGGCDCARESGGASPSCMFYQGEPPLKTLNEQSAAQTAGVPEFSEEAWEAKKAELSKQYPGIAGEYKVFEVAVITESGCDPSDGEFSVHISRLVHGFVSSDDLQHIRDAIWEEIKNLNLPAEGVTDITVYESGEREDVFWSKYYRVAAHPQAAQAKPEDWRKHVSEIKRTSDQSVQLVFPSCRTASLCENALKVKAAQAKGGEDE